jgi:hypothetical protein
VRDRAPLISCCADEERNRSIKVREANLDWRRELKGLQLAIRASSGAGLSYFLAQSIGLERPIFVLISAVIVTDLSPGRDRRGMDT